MQTSGKVTFSVRAVIPYFVAFVLTLRKPYSPAHPLASPRGKHHIWNSKRPVTAPSLQFLLRWKWGPFRSSSRGLRPKIMITVWQITAEQPVNTGKCVSSSKSMFSFIKKHDCRAHILFFLFLLPSTLPGAVIDFITQTSPSFPLLIKNSGEFFVTVCLLDEVLVCWHTPIG